MNTENSTVDLVEVQKRLMNIMIKFDAFCKEKGLVYYILGGTLLGAVRHHGYIPWDDDIDVGMIRDYYEKFLTLSSKFHDYSGY